MPTDNLASWLNNNHLLQEQYKKPNYNIRYGNTRSKLCLIFFSGNGLYYPNTETEFINRIIKDDRYEWSNITKSRIFQKKCAKIFFLRDIYKQWYVTGINQSLNTVEKLLNWLKKETEGYTIITAGSSAGGYAAVLFGLLLRAERIFSFSGQFILSDIEENPLLKKYANNNQYNQYYNLVDFCSISQTPIFYFYPALCEYDKRQAKAVASMCGEGGIYAYRIESAIHGDTVLPQNYRFLFFGKKKKLRKLYMRFKDKNITSKKLLCACSVLYAISDLFSLVYKRLKSFLKKCIINDI